MLALVEQVLAKRRVQALSRGVLRALRQRGAGADGDAPSARNHAAPPGGDPDGCNRALPRCISGFDPRGALSAASFDSFSLVLTVSRRCWRPASVVPDDCAFAFAIGSFRTVGGDGRAGVLHFGKNAAGHWSGWWACAPKTDPTEPKEDEAVESEDEWEEEQDFVGLGPAWEEGQEDAAYCQPRMLREGRYAEIPPDCWIGQTVRRNSAALSPEYPPNVELSVKYCIVLLFPDGASRPRERIQLESN
jgi:hypothetical protein